MITKRHSDPKLIIPFGKSAISNLLKLNLFKTFLNNKPHSKTGTYCFHEFLNILKTINWHFSDEKPLDLEDMHNYRLQKRTWFSNGI